MLGVNIGPNKDSIGDDRINDYLICLKKVNKHADYITINISSPNTPNLRDLHNQEDLSVLIDAIDKCIKDLGINKPIFIKISPDESDNTISNIYKSGLMKNYVNTKEEKIPLIGVGGVLSIEDFNKKIDAGASLVQIYTGFIIKGPNLINEVLNN